MSLTLCKSCPAIAETLGHYSAALVKPKAQHCTGSRKKTNVTLACYAFQNFSPSQTTTFSISGSSSWHASLPGGFRSWSHAVLPRSGLISSAKSNTTSLRFPLNRGKEGMRWTLERLSELWNKEDENTEINKMYLKRYFWCSWDLYCYDRIQVTLKDSPGNSQPQNWNGPTPNLSRMTKS